MEEKQFLGKKGEEIAENYLLENSYLILEKNWRYQKAEIDLIVQKGDFIVFVEVKTRSSIDFGNPEDFVSEKQQKRIINAAHEYLIQKDTDHEARFDIIAIVKQGNEYIIEHIDDAFYPT